MMDYSRKTGKKPSESITQPETERTRQQAGETEEPKSRKVFMMRRTFTVYRFHVNLDSDQDGPAGVGCLVKPKK